MLYCPYRMPNNLFKYPVNIDFLLVWSHGVHLARSIAVYNIFSWYATTAFFLQSAKTLVDFLKLFIGIVTSMGFHCMVHQLTFLTHFKFSNPIMIVFSWWVPRWEEDEFLTLNPVTYWIYRPLKKGTFCYTNWCVHFH